jgi:FMN phosphatase YigB (HAD superfamily)
MSIIIFDIDETLVDSSHRTPRKADGTVDLDHYRKNATIENIFKDTLLPLASEAKRLHAEGKHYIIFCTARHMHDADYAFLKFHGLHANTILSRDRATPKHYVMSDAKYKETWLRPFKTLRQFVGRQMIMFDDEKKVISAMRKMGITCFNAVLLNKRLAK